jgi:hypothetical protein
MINIYIPTYALSISVGHNENYLIFFLHVKVGRHRKHALKITRSEGRQLKIEKHAHV